MPPKDRKSYRPYFTFVEAEIRGVVQFYECMGIKYFKKDVF